MASAELKAMILQRWPAYAWLVDIPEIDALLQQAVNEDWAPDLFGAKLKATEWWRTRTDKARQWADLEATDPGTAVQRVNSAKAQVHSLAAELGQTMDDDTAGGIAWRFGREGWNEQQLRQAVTATVKPAGVPAVNVRALADRYMLSLSDGQINDFTQRLFTGELDQNALTGLMQTLATSQWPQLADQIAKGITPGDYFDQYKNQIAEMIGVNPLDIDLRRDPTWSRIVSTPDAKGGIRPMTLNEATQYIRSTSQFADSSRGQAEAAQFRVQLEQMFGAR
jgi:hypothetical protein